MPLNFNLTNVTEGFTFGTTSVTTTTTTPTQSDPQPINKSTSMPFSHIPVLGFNNTTNSVSTPSPSAQNNPGTTTNLGVVGAQGGPPNHYKIDRSLVVKIKVFKNPDGDGKQARGIRLSSAPPEVEYIEQTGADEFICGICQGLYNDPVMTGCCSEVYCKHCIKGWVQEKPTCPNCSGRLSHQGLRPPPKSTRSLLNKIKIKCIYKEEGCPIELKIGGLNVHLPICEYRPFQMCSNCEQVKISVRTHNCVTSLKKYNAQIIEEREKLKDENSSLTQENEQLQEEIIFNQDSMNNNLKQAILKLNNELIEQFTFPGNEIDPEQMDHTYLEQLVDNLIILYRGQVQAQNSEILNRDYRIDKFNQDILTLEDNKNVLISVLDEFKEFVIEQEEEFNEHLLNEKTNFTQAIGEFNLNREMFEESLQGMSEENSALNTRLKAKAKIISHLKTKIAKLENEFPECYSKFCDYELGQQNM